MICPKCKKENEDSAKFCGHCGELLESNEDTVVLKDISTKLKEEKQPKKYRDKTIPIVLGLSCLALLLALLLYAVNGGFKKGVVCDSGSENYFKVKYTAYEKNGKVNKVSLYMEEIDEESVLDEVGLEQIEKLLSEDAAINNETDGVSMNYKVVKKDKAELHIDVTMELDKIGDGYYGSMFVPYNPEWKDMTIDEFKKYMESYEGLSCK